MQRVAVSAGLACVLAFLSAPSLAQITEPRATNDSLAQLSAPSLAGLAGDTGDVLLQQAEAATPVSTQVGSDLLERMLAAGGWSPASLPRDAVAMAQVSMGSADGAPSTKTITFKARGRTQFRWEYSDAPGQASKSDLSAGLARAANGMGITTQAAQPWLLPFLGRLQEFADPSVRVEYLGTEVIGEPTYKLRFRRVPDPTDRRADEIKAGSPMTVWLSATTFLPVQIEYLQQSFTNRLAFMQRLRKYSDYRTVQGVLVPFHQEVWADKQLLSALDISSVQFNVGLPASDFQLTAASQGGR
jgi:hypothetical protein